MKMIDVQCPKCRRRFGWAGKFINRPPCPSCGHQVPREQLEAMDSRSEADEERRRTDPRCAAGEVLRQQRVDAGLTLRQAAKLMRIEARWLSDVESGRKELPEALAERVVEVYGLDPKED